MIPSLLLPGRVIGRWWLVPIAAVGRPIVLLAKGSAPAGSSERAPAPSPQPTLRSLFPCTGAQHVWSARGADTVHAKAGATVTDARAFRASKPEQTGEP